MTSTHPDPLSVLALLSAAGNGPNLTTSAPSSSTDDSGSDDTMCSSSEEQNDLDEADCTEQKGQSRTTVGQSRMEVIAADDSESQCEAVEGPQKASKDDMHGKKRPRDDDTQDGPGRRRVQWKKYGEKVLKRKAAVDANNVVYRYYYRCNYPGCTARKVLEKCFDANKRCKNMSSKVTGTHTHADEVFRYKKCYDEHECEDGMISVTPNQPRQIEGASVMMQNSSTNIVQGSAAGSSLGAQAAWNKLYGDAMQPAASQPLMQLLAMNQMNANANALSRPAGPPGNMNMNWNSVMMLGMQAGMEMALKMAQQQQ